jgi:hypothetical protein
MVAIKQDTTVQPGGLIQIRSNKLPDGARAQVIILIDSENEPSQPPESGFWKDQIKTSPDFDEPLPDSFWSGE